MSEVYGSLLVVDDEPEALALLVQILSEAGHGVQPADSGMLALAYIAVQTPDLILLDVRMPGMDGFEVCRRIKETESGRRIPLIFLSASSDREEWAHGLGLGAVDFVSKPFRREELLARVRTHLDLGRLRVNLEKQVAERTADLENAIDQLRREIGERRRAELALRESEERFRELANAAPAAIWTSGPDDQVDFWNQFALDFAGHTFDELAGHRWYELVHPDDRKRQRKAHSEAMQTRQRFQLECRMRRADGEYRSMLDVAAPRFRQSGEFAGYIGTLIDFTDVKRSQEQALNAKNLENLHLLSAGVAHDFNSLVGAILGEAYLASGDMDPDSPGRQNVDRILGIANRAADVVRLLMAYVGGQSDMSPPELVDLNAVIGEIIPYLKRSVTKSAEICTNLAPDLPSIRIKPAQIRQVVLNLVLHALEALEERPGQVAIATSHVEIATTGDSWQELAEGVYVKLEVSETGGGMSDEVLAKIFDTSYSTKFIGRGLGLAAAQGIIRTYDGRISAHRAPDGGSILEVLLPRASTP